jgi:hypothetical protein
LLLSVALAAALANACPMDNGIAAICGPVASEDIARVPGTHWLIASGLNIGSPANLYLIDSRSKSSRALFPRNGPALHMQSSFRGICPGPLQPERMSLDGLGVHAGKNGAPTLLLAANHGDRHAIEFFRIDMRPDPVLTWTGCVPMPTGTLANAVVPLSNGGMLVTSFHDPDDEQSWKRMDRGEATGGVWEWHAGDGWKPFPTGGIAGANGLEISADERTLYVSAWASRQLLVFDRALGTSRVIELDFRPDNIHRAMDGTLVVAGQRARVRDISACTGACPQPWIVARVEPGSGAVTPLLSGRGSELTNYACGALEVDGTLFMTLRGAARIAWAPLTKGPR